MHTHVHKHTHTHTHTHTYAYPDIRKHICPIKKRNEGKKRRFKNKQICSIEMSASSWYNGPSEESWQPHRSVPRLNGTVTSDGLARDPGRVGAHAVALSCHMGLILTRLTRQLFMFLPQPIVYEG